MRTAANQTIGEVFPTYAFTVPRLAALLGIEDSAIHLYAAEGMLPRLADDRYDGVWLLYLSIGQKVVARTQASLSVKATVALGWVESLGDDLQSAKDRDAFIAVFERNGFTRDDHLAAVDEMLAFCDAHESYH
ncbi:hypothetical protein [Paraburkholderia bryophila]|uniref:Uncharacterized protein n=1 Tax=Paraburkholderia bryophila TaxID=420952 RepID=A0A329BIF2_9BURK|nr:hypothetical protein [Paraburkholderia bryophila]RAS21510.1 hypothetical protein BX591_12829 [Paraburkholderia bryophila]